MDDSNFPLPKAPILGYVSNISTPTRVRIVAARGVFWVGVFLFLLTAVLFYWLISNYWNFVGPPTFAGLMPSLEYYPEYAIYFFLILIFSFAPALFLVSFTASIRRGRRVPSVFAMLSLLPFTLFLTLATALFIGAILVDIFSDRRHFHFGNAPWLLLTPIAVLIILLLKDLCAFLIWIARHPAAEKPPQPFLPAKNPPR
jgi:hypothetical protein